MSRARSSLRPRISASNLRGPSKTAQISAWTRNSSVLSLARWVGSTLRSCGDSLGSSNMVGGLQFAGRAAWIADTHLEWAGDQTSLAIVREIIVNPAGHDKKPIAKTNQEGDVDDRPH